MRVNRAKKGTNSTDLILFFLSGEPKVAEKRIVALGLGSSGHCQYISPEGTPGPTKLSTNSPDCEDTLQVCRHVTVPPQTGRCVSKGRYYTLTMCTNNNAAFG